MLLCTFELRRSLRSEIVNVMGLLYHGKIKERRQDRSVSPRIFIAQVMSSTAGFDDSRKAWITLIAAEIAKDELPLRSLELAYYRLRTPLARVP